MKVKNTIKKIKKGKTMKKLRNFKKRIKGGVFKKLNVFELRKHFYIHPERIVPKGDYCYSWKTKKECIFWDFKFDLPEQENGYCHLLKKSDWEINEENEENIVEIKTGKKIKELWENDIDEKTNKKTHFPASLLWDQCKECSVRYCYY